MQRRSVKTKLAAFMYLQSSILRWSSIHSRDLGSNSQGSLRPGHSPHTQFLVAVEGCLALGTSGPLLQGNRLDPVGQKKNVYLTVWGTWSFTYCNILLETCNIANIFFYLYIVIICCNPHPVHEGFIKVNVLIHLPSDVVAVNVLCHLYIDWMLRLHYGRKGPEAWVGTII